MIKRLVIAVCVLVLCIGSARGDFIGGGSGGGSSGGGSSGTLTTNTLPTVVSSNHVTGTGTSFTIPAPSSITNGNALYAQIFIGVSGTASETWTPPAGFSQIGSTIVSNAGSFPVLSAVFCKTAASESGGYLFSWNNTTSFTSRGEILNISGGSCTNDGQGTQNALGASITVAPFTTAKANDLLIVGGAQSSAGGSLGTVTVFTPSNATTTIDTGTQALMASLPSVSGTGKSPSILLQAVTSATGGGLSTTGDFVGIVTAIPATVTATNNIVSNNDAASLSWLQVNGATQASNQIFGSYFEIGNSSSPSALANSYAAENASGVAFPLMVLNSSNNITIDPTNVSTNIAFGAGATSARPNLLINNTSCYAEISNDTSQDIGMMALDTSNDLLIGQSGTNICGQSGTQMNDVFLRLQTGKTLHESVNSVDIETLNATSLNLLAGATLQSTGGTAPTVTCSGGSTGTSVTAGSTNNRGSIVSSSSASTNCTITWSAAGTWNQAPFCHFFDAGASTTPIAYSMGACGTSTCVVDFASATSKTIGYMCM